jgi:hypothetical protein
MLYNPSEEDLFLSYLSLSSDLLWLVPMDGQEAVTTHMLYVCGLTLAQRNAVTNVKGIQDIATLASRNLPRRREADDRKSLRLGLNRGGAYIGMSATAKIKALIWWVQDAHAQGNGVDPNDWDTEILDHDARKGMLLEKLGRDKVDDIVEAPKRLDPSKWVNKYLAFINFLRGQTSADGKHTLDYVVRKDPPPGWTPTSREDCLKYNAPLTCPFYNQDNQQVYRVTK